MTIIVTVISFIVIWLGTTFFIFRHVKKLRDDLFNRLSDTERPPKKNSGHIPAEDKEDVYSPFDCVKRADPENLLNFIKKEHPQIIALVLAHLEPEKASVILRNLPSELQSDLSLRIATLDRVSPEITREIEQVLEKKLGALSGENFTAAGGVESIVEILNHVDSDSGNQIIKALEDKDPEIAYKINNGLKTLLPKTNR